MSWKFGDIDFEEYGVMVSKSTGVLDLPKLSNEGFNWLDVDGIDYQQEYAEITDRDIILNCWIYAKPSRNMGGEITITGYDNFRNKVQYFTDAIKAAGKVTFQTPYLDINNCSISSGISIVRETNYVLEQQVGTFSLRITVHGDSKFTLLSILDKSSDTLVAIVKTSNLILNKTLQGDSYVTCTVESNSLLDVEMYDWIKINSNGYDDEKYHLATEPEYRKVSSNKFVYDFRFDGAESYLSQTMFMLDGQSEFSFYGDLETIIDLIVTNSNRFLSGKFVKGGIELTIKKNHAFRGENCLEVLKRIVAEYNMEYQLQLVTGQVYYYINCEEQIGVTKSVTLQYGKGKGLYELTRGRPDTSKLCTVLYAYGAAKNLKTTYGAKRLQCPGNPLTSNLSTYLRHEKVEFFEDIYPQRTATVTGYIQVLPENLTAAEREVYPEGIFVVGDTTINFDINAYLLGGRTAKISMKTGALAGFEFDILRYDHANTLIYIIRFLDEQGGLLPNATLQIAAGDEYTLVDIEQPPTYLAAAESALALKALEYITKWSTPIYPFTAVVNPAFILATPFLGFEVGEKVTIVDADYGINTLFRISALTLNKNTGIYTLTLSDYRSITKRKQTEFRLQTIERAIFSANKQAVEVVKDEQQPAGEVKRVILDPDNVLRVDQIIANDTIDARMLGLDANMPQVSLTDAWFESNVGGNIEAAKQYAGIITIHNYASLNRFEVQKLKDNNEVYDPSRTWEIPETTFTAAADTSYNIYAKLDLTPASTACEVFLHEDHIDAKAEIESGFVIYKLGNLTKQIV